MKQLRIHLTDETGIVLESFTYDLGNQQDCDLNSHIDRALIVMDIQDALQRIAQNSEVPHEKA
jgi:hypothetical protein